MNTKMEEIIFHAKMNISNKYHCDISILPYEKFNIREELFKEIVDLSIKECINTQIDFPNKHGTKLEFLSGWIGGSDEIKTLIKKNFELK